MQILRNPASIFFDESVKAWSALSFAGKFLQKAARAPVLFHP